MKTTIHTENGVETFTTGREARKFRRQIGAVLAVWGVTNIENICGGGNSGYAFYHAAGSVGGRYSVGPSNGWEAAGLRYLGYYVTRPNTTRGWATPGFLRQYVAL